MRKRWEDMAELGNERADGFSFSHYFKKNDERTTWFSKIEMKTVALIRKINAIGAKHYHHDNAVYEHELYLKEWGNPVWVFELSIRRESPIHYLITKRPQER